jgi:hypothetical protein
MPQPGLMKMRRTFMGKTCLSSDGASIAFADLLNSGHRSLKYAIQFLLIQTFHNPLQALNNYVMDFGIKFVNGTPRAHIIEINPFGKMTGACLFDWNQDIDVIVGQKPFEFRIVTEQMVENVDYATVIFPDWVAVIKEAKTGIVQKHKRKSFCNVAENLSSSQFFVYALCSGPVVDSACEQVTCNLRR